MKEKSLNLVQVKNNKIHQAELVRKQRMTGDKCNNNKYMKIRHQVIEKIYRKIKAEKTKKKTQLIVVCKIRTFLIIADIH